MKIRLTDADRELYGGPEWLEWDAGRFTVSEAEAFQEHIRDEQGNPIAPQKYQQWLQQNKSSITVIKWAMWLGIRRAGVAVGWDAFDPDFLRAAFLADPEPEPAAKPAGKAPGRSTRPRRSVSAAKP